METTSTPLNNPVICPTCWSRFHPEDTLWISTHPSLLGDPKVGDYEPTRFLPTRFDIQCNAIDAKGSKCTDIACPRCHLRIPRASLELRTLFLSIAGTPSAGKSYFLTSMAWQMRQNFPREFRVAVGDADPICNRVLNAYEEMQFFAADQNTPVKLKKTEEIGDDYASTNIDGQMVQYVSPFLFAMRPLPSHPNAKMSEKASRLISMYDNAGESFQPGKDGTSNPVTQHLGISMAVFFCYDALQDPRVRGELSGKTNDSQVTEQAVTARQEIILHEVIGRIRRLKGLAQSDRIEMPFVVITTKYDAWKHLLKEPLRERPTVPVVNGLHALDLKYLRMVSQNVREILGRFSPELVSTVEAFSKNPWYLPVSATGCSPQVDPNTGIRGVRPGDIKPFWCDIPMALVISCFSNGLIPFIDRDAN